jgi:hypothetical protein
MTTRYFGASIARNELHCARRVPLRQPDHLSGFAPLHYDSGDYGPVLDKALDAIGYRAFIAEEQPQLRAAGAHHSDRAIVGSGTSLTGRLYYPDAPQWLSDAQRRLFASKIPECR